MLDIVSWSVSQSRRRRCQDDRERGERKDDPGMRSLGVVVVAIIKRLCAVPLAFFSPEDAVATCCIKGLVLRINMGISVRV